MFLPNGITPIIKADGNTHWFAADMEWLVDHNQAIPFSHTEFARLHLEEQAKAICENVKMDSDPYCPEDEWVDRNSILNAYPLDNIK